VKPARILIVEDEAIEAAYLKEILVQMGYEVVGQAATGKKAVELALARRPNAILMDIRLRGEMTGIQAAEAIHKSEDIPIIFLSAFSDELLVESVKTADAAAFLVKPVRDRELRAELEVALYKHSSEAQLKHLIRVLRAVRDVNQLITHEQDPLLLLEGACRILAHTRGYSLVWIGKADAADGLVHPLTHAGDQGGYLDGIRITWDESPWGQGPTGSAVRERKPVVCRDFTADPRVEPWREAALRHGFASAAAIPIQRRGTLFGVLTVDADKVDFFGEDEVALLVELAGDLAFALDALEDEAARRQAEAALQESEMKFRNVFQNSRDAIVVNRDDRHVFENQAYLRLYGYDSPEELADRPVLDLVAPSHRDQIAEYVRLRRAGQAVPAFYESRGLRKDGSEFDTEIQASTFDLHGQVHILAIIRDVTERKKAEDRLRRSFEELRETLRSAIKALASAIEMRDPYTSGHQERVTRLAVAIAREMGLDEDRVEGVRIAGTVHDIGKLSIPAGILSKPAKLAPVEYSLIQSHSQIGFTILENIRFPWPIARIVLQHHERMNGSGYPNKLSGEEILVEASIIAVADVVEAMSSHRPYRPSLGTPAALEEISRQKGVLYDPGVVDACLKVFRQPGFTLD
jgi:PAS domain S-box-containing protein/putative nucleotidyltransferase with HDIG domain